MTPHLRRPIEVFSSKRRASTTSTGLDYPTCYRVDEDILSRIRLLLLSRNTHCPPRTPYTSDEYHTRRSEHCCTTEAPDRFDFNTAKSVSRLLARTEGDGVAFSMHSRSQSASFRMDGARRPTTPSVSISRRSLRASSSTNGLGTSHDDAPLHAALLPCCPPCPPEGTNKGFRLPRLPLILKDKTVKKQRDMNFRSCIDFTSDTPPAKDSPVKSTDPPCCPPLDVLGRKQKMADRSTPNSLQETDAPRRLSGKVIKAEPADLACFLAGCGPGECKKHSRRFSQPVSPREESSVNPDDIRMVDDIAKLGVTAMAVKQFAGTSTNARPRLTLLQNESDLNTRKSKGSDRVHNSPLTKSPTSSIFSIDVFPHVAHSQTVAARAALQQSLSSTIVTNFSLSSPKPKTVQDSKPSLSSQVQSFGNSMQPELEPVRTKFSDSSLMKIPESILSKPTSDVSTSKAIEPLRKQHSVASLRSKTNSPSIRSGASKASSIRHALLKPSLSTEQLDTGLPIPPVLSEIAVTSSRCASVQKGLVKSGTAEISLNVEIDIASKDDPNLSGVGLEVGTSAGIVDHLTSLKKAKNLAKQVNDRVSKTKERSREEKAREGSTATVVQRVPTAEILDPISQPDIESTRESTMNPMTNLKSLLDASETQNASTKGPRRPECRLDSMLPSQSASGNAKNLPCCPGIVSQIPQSLPVIDYSNAAYWGFGPAVKEAVQDAVQTAVRQAVQEIVVPPGSPQDQVASAYRKLFGDSLAEAAQDADKYLRRASLWNEPPSRNQERSEGNIDFHHSVPADQQPLMAGGEPREILSDAGISYEGDLGISCIAKQSTPPARNSNGIGGSASPDDMETVPLETVDERLVENHKQGWKTLDSWSGLGKKRSSGYSTIPMRKSSKNQALSSKNQTTPESSVKESPRGSRWRKRSVEKLTSKTNRAVRSESSVESQRSVQSWRRDRTDEQESVMKEPTATTVDQNLINKVESAERLGRKNTVHWLRELLSSDRLYESKLTAFPPRTRRDEDPATGRIRSQTAPAKPVKELYLDVIPQSDQSNAVVKSTLKTGGVDKEAVILGPGNGDQQNAAMTEAFSKTISDLEILLSEALFIARQAAEREDSAFAPRLLGRAAAVLTRGRKGVRTEIRRRKDASSIASMHESFGSFSSSDSEASEQAGRSKQKNPEQGSLPQLHLEAPTVGILDSTELPQIGHHDSGWPPTGRGPTPNLPVSPLEDSGGESSGSPVSGNIEISDVNPFITGNSENERKRSVATSQVSPTKRSRSTTRRRSQQIASCILETLTHSQNPPSGPLPMPPITPRGASLSNVARRRATETDPEVIRPKFATESVSTKREVREYIKAFHHPPIQQRASSLNLNKQAEKEQAKLSSKSPTVQTFSWQNIDRNDIESCSQDEIQDPALSGGLAKPNSFHDRASAISKSYDGSQPSEAIYFDTGYTRRQHGAERVGSEGREAIELRDKPNPDLPQVTRRGGKGGSHLFNLEGRNHISLRGEHHKGFSFARTHKKPKIARDWAPARKRFVATVACISTALVGILVGIYAAEVPAIQYWIVDFHHYTILGNVFFFIGLSIPTFFFWPLPLLHGRKPYTLGALSLAMPLLFPQALAVGQFRSPYVDYWRVGLIMPRALMGFMLGFANMNFKSTLTDLFGASLQSENPHQEVVDENDVRRHGGGLGVWLGIWTWCAMGSIGVGFLFGAIIINHANPAWGFYISIAIIAFVLLLNVICPEVRRSAFRRSVAELKHEDGVSRRLGRGEVKMHMVHTGPKWWGEEFHYGVKLNARMLRQPGFMVLAVYVSWIYGQIVLLVVLLGSLTSKYYKFTSPYVGASVMAIPIGAFLAIPFQKASLFSRSRGNAELEDDNAETLKKRVTLSSHLVRRAIFILVLPFAGLGYTLSSNGPPIPFIIPILFAGLIGFLSNLAMGECHGIIMETFDTSDLQPGMTGRARNSDKANGKRTNYSSFPRVSSGFAITQGIGYLFAALATGVGGVAERNIGQQAATGVMAAILLVLSLLLLGVLYRFRDVQIIPNSKQDDMQKWQNARRTSAILRAEGIDQQEEWRPIIIGNPTHIMRRMCILEMGGMTRWSEIRLKNHLVDSNALEAKHPNLAVFRDVEHRIKEAEQELIHHVHRSISRHSLSRNSSRRSKRSDRSYEQPGDLGGHREMLHPSGNGGGKRQRGKSRIEE